MNGPAPRPGNAAPWVRNGRQLSWPNPTWPVACCTIDASRAKPRQHRSHRGDRRGICDRRQALRRPQLKVSGLFRPARRSCTSARGTAPAWWMGCLIRSRMSRPGWLTPVHPVFCFVDPDWGCVCRADHISGGDQTTPRRLKRVVETDRGPIPRAAWLTRSRQLPGGMTVGRPCPFSTRAGSLLFWTSTAGPVTRPEWRRPGDVGCS